MNKGYRADRAADRVSLSKTGNAREQAPDGQWPLPPIEDESHLWPGHDGFGRFGAPFCEHQIPAEGTE